MLNYLLLIGIAIGLGLLIGKGTYLLKITGVIGYIITDLDSNVIVEFALGESPYENLIERSNTKLYSKSKKHNTIALVKDGPKYLVTEDNFATKKLLHKSKYINEDCLHPTKF